MQFPRSTDRLDFREWQPADFEPFHAICSDPRVMRFVGEGRPWGPGKTREFIERAIRLSRSHGYCQWPLIHRGDQVLIGYAGFVSSPEGPEVGWRLAPDYWGQGLATEAARAVIQHGFEVLKFSHILATVQEENVASLRVIEKLGMCRQTSFRRQGKNIVRYTIGISEESCPKCRAPLPADAPAGVCPRCLMAGGLESTVVSPAPQAELPEPGATFGPYQLGQLLGRGGMGAVYEAEHIESGRRVALKVLNHKLESPDHRRRFLREGRLAASVTHPNSVYIFGTDEIGGAPVIAMELAGGGTLQDRVKHDGPLAVGEAVDVILQIIDGLEAAESAGVLHRDVKPSNCFLDMDGVAKIGDFGLSVSTTSRAETNLTQSGVFLGTPVYSSPEQLRGDELDVRSDIYSVGVTLFYLLTGRTPFEANHMVQLLATVLERPAPSPVQFRSDIPVGLAKVVDRCLAKRNSQRYRRYDDLREALLPYTSASPTPATLGFRVLAIGIDVLVLGLLAALVPLLWFQDVPTWSDHGMALISGEPSRRPLLMLLGVCGLVLQLSYFAIGEGLWGMTVGKAVCRLRVVGSRREPPGVRRSALRVGCFLAPYFAPLWILFAMDAVRGTKAYEELTWFFVIGSVLQVLLFVTVRRRNGYAAIHELASGTRVVRAGTRQHRPRLSLLEESPPEVSPSELQGERKIGPYHVLGEVDADPCHPLVLGYDTRLLRRVWIRPCAAGAEPVPAHLRELSRIGRLRWLNGRRTPDGGWDAYEAPTGKPLLQVIVKKQPWNMVRFWLLDLAEELRAGQIGNSGPDVLQLDRVWITADGRAKLLDFPAPGLCTGTDDRRDSDTGNPEETAAAVFLKRVAIAALTGSIVSGKEAKSRDMSIPMPVSARQVLSELGRSADSALPVAHLESFTKQSAVVSEAKRVGVLAACWIGPLILAVLGTIHLYSEREFLRRHPEVGELAGYVEFYRLLDEQDERRSAVEIVVAHRYRKLLMNSDIWSSHGIDGFLDANDRRLVEGFLDVHANPSQDQVSTSVSQLADSRTAIHNLSSSADDSFYAIPGALMFVGTTTGVLLLLVIVPGFLSVLLWGNSLLLRSLDIVVVTEDGRPASRLRQLWRNMVLWSLVLIALALLIWMASHGRVRVSILLLIGWVVHLFIAERTLHDRLAGTWLVPR